MGEPGAARGAGHGSLFVGAGGEGAGILLELVSGVPRSPGLLSGWAFRPRPLLSGPFSPGRGGRVLHAGARDPAAQGAQAEPTGRGRPGLHELQVPALLTPLWVLCARPAPAQAPEVPDAGRRGGRKEVPEPGQPRLGGQSDRGPPRTLCTDCHEPRPLFAAPSRPTGCRFNCSKLFDGLDPGVWPRLGSCGVCGLWCGVGPRLLPASGPSAAPGTSFCKRRLVTRFNVLTKNILWDLN